VRNKKERDQLREKLLYKYHNQLSNQPPYSMPSHRFFSVPCPTSPISPPALPIYVSMHRVTHPYPPSEIQPQPTHIPATPIQRKGRKGNYPLQQAADVSVIKKKEKHNEMQSQIRQRYGRATRVEEEKRKKSDKKCNEKRKKRKKKKRIYYFSQRFISYFMYEPPALL